jgi:hypothetical protein
MLLVDINVRLYSGTVTLQQFNFQHRVAKTHLRDCPSLIIVGCRVQRIDIYMFYASSSHC